MRSGLAWGGGDFLRIAVLNKTRGARVRSIMNVNDRRSADHTCVSAQGSIEGTLAFLSVVGANIAPSPDDRDDKACDHVDQHHRNQHEERRVREGRRRDEQHDADQRDECR